MIPTLALPFTPDDFERVRAEFDDCGMESHGKRSITIHLCIVNGGGMVSATPG